MTKSNIQISFIVLCFNEEKNINKTIEEIFKTSKVCDLKNFEIIVIDDGSFDNSYNIVKKHKSIKKFKNKINLGMGGAYKAGLKKSKGEYVIMIPGDNSHPVSSIKPIIERKGTTDMIIPYTDKKGNRNFFRYILSKLFTGLVNYIFKLNLNYYTKSYLSLPDPCLSNNHQKNFLQFFDRSWAMWFKVFGQENARQQAGHNK